MTPVLMEHNIGRSRAAPVLGETRGPKSPTVVSFKEEELNENRQINLCPLYPPPSSYPGFYNNNINNNDNNNINNNDNNNNNNNNAFLDAIKGNIIPSLNRNTRSNNSNNSSRKTSLSLTSSHNNMKYESPEIPSLFIRHADTHQACNKSLPSSTLSNKISRSNTSSKTTTTASPSSSHRVSLVDIRRRTTALKHEIMNISNSDTIISRFVHHPPLLLASRPGSSNSQFGSHYEHMALLHYIPIYNNNNNGQYDTDRLSLHSCGPFDNRQITDNKSINNYCQRSNNNNNNNNNNLQTNNNNKMDVASDRITWSRNGRDKSVHPYQDNNNNIINNNNNEGSEEELHYLNNALEDVCRSLQTPPDYAANIQEHISLQCGIYRPVTERNTLIRKALESLGHHYSITCNIMCNIQKREGAVGAFAVFMRRIMGDMKQQASRRDSSRRNSNILNNSNSSNNSIRKVQGGNSISELLDISRHEAEFILDSKNYRQQQEYQSYEGNNNNNGLDLCDIMTISANFMVLTGEGSIPPLTEAQKEEWKYIITTITTITNTVHQGITAWRASIGMIEEQLQLSFPPVPLTFSLGSNIPQPLYNNNNIINNNQQYHYQNTSTSSNIESRKNTESAVVGFNNTRKTDILSYNKHNYNSNAHNIKPQDRRFLLHQVVDYVLKMEKEMEIFRSLQEVWDIFQQAPQQLSGSDIIIKDNKTRKEKHVKSLKKSDKNSATNNNNNNNKMLPPLVRVPTSSSITTDKSKKLKSSAPNNKNKGEVLSPKCDSLNDADQIIIMNKKNERGRRKYHVVSSFSTPIKTMNKNEDNFHSSNKVIIDNNNNNNLNNNNKADNNNCPDGKAKCSFNIVSSHKPITIEELRNELYNDINNHNNNDNNITNNINNNTDRTFLDNDNNNDEVINNNTHDDVNKTIPAPLIVNKGGMGRGEVINISSINTSSVKPIDVSLHSLEGVVGEDSLLSAEVSDTTYSTTCDYKEEYEECHSSKNDESPIRFDALIGDNRNNNNDDNNNNNNKVIAFIQAVGRGYLSRETIRQIMWVQHYLYNYEKSKEKKEKGLSTSHSAAVMSSNAAAERIQVWWRVVNQTTPKETRIHHKHLQEDLYMLHDGDNNNNNNISINEDSSFDDKIKKKDEIRGRKRAADKISKWGKRQYDMRKENYNIQESKHNNAATIIGDFFLRYSARLLLKKLLRFFVQIKSRPDREDHNLIILNNLWCVAVAKLHSMKTRRLQRKKSKERERSHEEEVILLTAAKIRFFYHSIISRRTADINNECHDHCAEVIQRNVLRWLAVRRHDYVRINTWTMLKGYRRLVQICKDRRDIKQEEIRQMREYCSVWGLCE